MKAKRRQKKPDDPLEELVILLVMASFVPLSFAVVIVENTIGGLRLLAWACGLGAVVGWVLANWVTRQQFFKPSEHVSVRAFRVAMVLAFTLAAPGIASGLNIYLPAGATYQQQCKITGKYRSRTARTGRIPMLLISIDGREEQLWVQRYQWNSVNVGDSITLTLKPGFFGFPWVIEPPASQLRATILFKRLNPSDGITTQPGPESACRHHHGAGISVFAACVCCSVVRCCCSML